MNLTNEYYRSLVYKAKIGGLPVKTRNDNVRRLVHETFVCHRTPLVTLRKTAWKNCLREWEWFMSGSNNVQDLHESVRPWWQPWADKRGDIPFNYSEQFRSSGSALCPDGYQTAGFDQIGYLIDGIFDHPHSRRNVITTWNTSDMADPSCPITNCHGTVIQAFVGTCNDPNALSLVTYQRSADLICGVPHNWFQYWAFLLWLAHRTGKTPFQLTWIGGDVHLYEEHLPVAEQILQAELSRESPELVYKPTSGDFKADDFSLDREYKPLVLTKARMIV